MKRLVAAGKVAGLFRNMAGAGWSVRCWMLKATLKRGDIEWEMHWSPY